MGTFFVRLNTTLSVEEWRVLSKLLMRPYCSDEAELEVINKIQKGIEFDLAPFIDPFAADVDDLPL